MPTHIVMLISFKPSNYTAGMFNQKILKDIIKFSLDHLLF